MLVFCEIEYLENMEISHSRLQENVFASTRTAKNVP